MAVLKRLLTPFPVCSGRHRKQSLKLQLSSMEIQSLNQRLWLLQASLEVFEVHFRFFAFKNRQMIGRGRGEEVWVSGFKRMRSFFSLPISQTADVTRWEWILNLFWFPSYNPSAFSLLPLGNLCSLQNQLTDNHSYRQQTHTHYPTETLLPKSWKLLRITGLSINMCFCHSLLPHHPFKEAICDHILGGNTIYSRWAL